MLEFGDMFEAVTGNKPMAWQCRLYDQFLANDIKPVIDLPTGMGKTSVMAIWLIARAKQIEEKRTERLPTRLVYVVDRRTVVDRATVQAEKILCKAKQEGFEVPAVSTLRGQLADNREWSRDPTKPAIIIGTVDLIGSALLFSGYRSSYKRRPLEAGLFGQDSLLILDEAHLSKPFDKLLSSICEFQKGRDGQRCGKPMKVVRMSATCAATDGNSFRLEGDFDTRTSDFSDETIRRRYSAAKRLQIQPPVEKAKLNAEMVDKAINLAEDCSRVVVFVRSPEDAQRIAEIIRKDKSFRNAVAVLTGTMRGLERDELVDMKNPPGETDYARRVMQRFLLPENKPGDGPAILMSTSAGEVGFDLNADHMVCDAAPLDSMIQRLGRVNRRGRGNAEVHIFVQKNKESKEEDKNKKEKSAYEVASIEALKTLKQLPPLEDGAYDASPQALALLAKPDAALSPKPTMVELTDILLDNWSMTTIVEPMPGRPPVAPWLRGIADELPDTTISWRAELDVDGFDKLDIDDIEEWFDAHRVLPHETLTLPTSKAAETLVKRWKNLTSERQQAVGGRACVIDRGGLRRILLRDLIENLQKKRDDAIINADLILPASFGGIKRNEGIFDPADNSDKTTDVADEPGSGGEQRYRAIRTGETEQPLLADSPPDSSNLAKFTLDLPSDDDTVHQLSSLVPKRQRPEYGTREQFLAEHVAAVEKHAAEIVCRLALAEEVQKALELAAKWHDNGKAREIWQRAVKGNMTEPLAKSGGTMRPVAGDYRHEFGSLCEFAGGHGEKLDSDVFDLAMHLIATHHGRSRPHFPKGGFDPDARKQSPEIAVNAMRRFARLQRKYGHWYLAWLENLLRCADTMASANSNGGEKK